MSQAKSTGPLLQRHSLSLYFIEVNVSDIKFFLQILGGLVGIFLLRSTMLKLTTKHLGLWYNYFKVALSDFPAVKDKKTGITTLFYE